jgi:hypothetical protein
MPQSIGFKASLLLAENCRSQLEQLTAVMQTKETSRLLLKASSRVEVETEVFNNDAALPEAALGLPRNFHLWLGARADEARAFVQQATDHTVREDLLRLAEDYDKIARQTAPRRNDG